MPTKKRTIKKKPEKNSALSGAIKDLEKEIQSALKEKTTLKKTLENVAGAINIDRTKEKELQEKIARLMEKEASLNARKKKLESQIDTVSDKISKITKIESEMKDI